ncbi:MAG: hypothetical protein EPN22_03785 [Nitrospirae bacterium]|nr:MAG: hypothetical protein EPN22_03785 [Nitrospirota bacterium]
MKRAIDNEKGFALVMALVVMLLMLVMAGTAMTLSRLGYMSVGSERRYQLAASAAEYGLNTGVNLASTSSCPTSSSNCGTLSGGGSCTYFGIADSSSTNCFIIARGQTGTAAVYRTAVVPIYASSYGALTLRNGGEISLTGSSSIVNCDTTCATPAVVAGGNLEYSAGGGLHNTNSCPNNPSGLYGSTSAIAMGNAACNTSPCSGTTLTDRVPKVFNATDFNDLTSKVAAASAKTVNGQNLTVSISGTGEDVIPTVSGMPAAPTPSCTCTNASITLTSSTSSCTGVANFSACSGNVKFNGTVTVNGVPATITNLVSAGNVTIGADISGKGIYTTGTAGVSVTANNIDITNSNIISAGKITINSNNGTITNSNVSSSGTISGDPHNVIEITNISTISGSAIVASASDHAEIYLGAGNVSNALITAKDEVRLNTAGTISNSKVLAKEIEIGHHDSDTDDGADGGSSGQIGDITGTLLFGGEVEIEDMTSNTNIGTAASPVMIIGAGEVELEDVGGNVSLNGLVFANGELEIEDNSGTFAINGAVVGNSTSEGAELSAGGNMSIKFDKAVLNTLYSSFSSFMKAPPCSSSGSPAAYTSNTKMSVY